MNFLNSINIDDVSQGDVGDCWLLSSIIAVVNFGQNLINDIICLEENLKNPNGPFKFKFHKCGKWHSGRINTDCTAMSVGKLLSHSSLC